MNSMERHVCWMAESSQLPPRARMNVHNSVISVRSPPSTARPLARSMRASRKHRALMVRNGGLLICDWLVLFRTEG